MEDSLRADWTRGLQVEEKQLQEYMCQKQHTITLKGATAALKHTLEHAATTGASDGFIHFGDSLMLRNACTQGLLQADIAAEAPPCSQGIAGVPLSTGNGVLTACARTVFTISRVDDNDGFNKDTYVHYGQVIRLGSGPELTQRPHYLWADAMAGAAQNEHSAETVYLYPRAAQGSHWRVCPTQRTLQRRGLTSRQGMFERHEYVKLGDPVQLESVAAGFELVSDSTVIMTSYGNEYRVFGATTQAPAAQENSKETAAGNQWLFIDSEWAEGVIQSAKNKAYAQAYAPQSPPNSPKSKDSVILPPKPKRTMDDPVALLLDPLYRAEANLEDLELQGKGAQRYAVLARIYPLLKGNGMHVVRRLRRMCLSSDLQGTGVMSMRTFQGLLSYVSIRLIEDEVQQLQALFGCDRDGQRQPQGSDTINFNWFFQLMGSMSNLRIDTVHDAYKVLKEHAVAGIVEIRHIRQHYRAKSHPEVQTGQMTVSQAMEDFLRQWDIDHHDGVVSWEEFLDYYRDVSTAVEDDEIFVEIVRSAWDLQKQRSSSQ